MEIDTGYALLPVLAMVPVFENLPSSKDNGGEFKDLLSGLEFF
jgi:hypothetical protein